MNIEKIDKAFEIQPINEPDVEWFEIPQVPFSLHGVFYDEKEEYFRRMPMEIAEEVNRGVAWGSRVSAGGRVRFMTNSPYIAIKCVQDAMPAMWNMPWIGSCGFSVYSGNEFRGIISTRPNAVNVVDAKFAFEGILHLPTLSLEEITIHMPLYNRVRKMYVGLKKGSVVQEPKPYAYQKPVVFYGSSITQGGCASHSGNDYQSFLSRALNFDFINLGFSGNARAEQNMCEYLAALDSSVFVLDYDHNAPNVEHLQNTHYNLYDTVRKANPKTPILLISAPDFDVNKTERAERRSIIYQTYKRAKKQGDKRIWFIDGETLFGKNERSACSVDGAHPNDLGFYRMAQTIAPVLKKALKKSK